MAGLAQGLADSSPDDNTANTTSRTAASPTTAPSYDHHSKPPGGRPLVVDNLLDGPSPTAWRDFKHARLRQFTGHGDQIKWLVCLGSGVEGTVFKVIMGTRGSFALKIGCMPPSLTQSGTC
ncbi:hypothetical protein C8A05DRAFT_20482 [Staphylotrichum tortipilum]|uniref:Uncharacterized protein n=1 Tax=Staphylotrichum tortipilum TaxID=2831512 RepID=A0AAN6RLY4_9PEZI|nr:hypothetical protein C8A05DRAFT_20482 [Staphylotrichum longicolle]